MSFSPPTPPAIQLPKAPAQPPMFGSPVQGQKPGRKPMQPSFVGAQDVASPSQTSQKTLLGS